MKRSKRILALVLALTMLFTMFPMAAIAVEGTETERPIIDLTQNLYATDNIVSVEELAEIIARAEAEAIAPFGAPVVQAAWGLFANATEFSAHLEGGNLVRPTSGVQTAPRLAFWEINPPATGTAAQRPLSISFNGAGAGNNFVGLANAMWYQTTISTVGIENILVEWAMRTTATGPGAFQLQYSTVGSPATAADWNNVPGGAFRLAVPAAGTNNLENEANQFSAFLPESAEDEAVLHLRWVMTSNYSSRAGTGTFPANEPIGATGTLTMGNMRITSGVDRAITIAEANELEIGARAEIVGRVTRRTVNAAATAYDNTTIFVQGGLGAKDAIMVWGGTGSNLSAYVGQWVRVEGTIGHAAGGAGSGRRQIALGTTGTIEIIPPRPFVSPTIPATLEGIIDRDHWFMPIILGPVQFGHNDDRATFLTAPGVNTSAAPARSHFIIAPDGQRIELRPPIGAANDLPNLATGDWITVTRAYVTWQNARATIQLLHATVVPRPAPAVAVPTASPASGSMLPDGGGDVVLTSTTAGAEIRFRVNGGAWQTAASPATVTVNTFVSGVATIEAYARVGASESTTATFTFHEYEPTTVLSIAQANAAAVNDVVTVRGFVTGNDGTGRVFVQDSMEEWGGIIVQGTNVSAFVGQWVEITGTRIQQWAQPAINNATLTAIPAPGTVIEAVELPISVLAAGRPGPWNSMLVTFRAEIRERVATTGLAARHVLDVEPRAVIRGTLDPAIENGTWVRVDRAIPHWNGTEGNIQLVTGWNSGATITAVMAPLVTDVLADPPSGSAIPLGSEVLLTTTPDVARIEFRVNGGPLQTSDAATVAVTVPAFDQAGDTATIWARSVLPDPSGSGILDYSLPQVFTYTQAVAANVVPDRVSGRVTAGTELTLTTATPNATIRFIFTERAGMPDELVRPVADYTAPIVLGAGMFPIHIEAWTTANGFIDGAVTELEFELRVRGGENIFFGQLHAHSWMSDCHLQRTPESAFAEARDVAGLDFFALSDHSNWFNWGYARPGGALAGPGDMPESAAHPNGFNLREYNIDRWHLDNSHTVTLAPHPSQGGTNYQWERGNQAARNATVDGEFIAINGFEFTWAGGPGHMNTFNTTGWVCRRNAHLNVSNNDQRLLRYYELLRSTPESISMFNHPGTTFGNFNNFAHFDPEVALRIPLIEAANGEGAIGSGGYFPAFEQYVLALDRGWLVAPVNSQDNHRGQFGWANEGRVAIYTNDFTEEGMWQAFRDRAVYFTEIRDIEIRYYADFAGASPLGEPMGSLIQHVPSDLSFRAEVYIPEVPRSVQGGFTNPRPRDNYTITRMELVTNGGVVPAWSVQTFNVPVGQTAEYVVTPTSVEPGYYFLRVIAVNSQGRERVNMTAPIWIGRAAIPLVGISEVESDTFMPVTTEELTLTANFFNDQPYAVTVQTIEWIRNGVVYRTFAPGQVIPAGDSAQYATLDYTPAAMGNVSFTVRAIMTADGWGAPRVYYGFIDLFVRDITRVGFIGIDAAHFNEYIDGNYRGSFTNFAQLAAQHDLVTVVFRTEAEIIAAANDPRFGLLLFSSPGRHASIVNDPDRGEHRDFSPAMIAAVGGFVERGGTLAVAGFGNFNDQGGATIPPERRAIQYAQSFQLNQLLVAAGSNIRVGDTSHTAPLGFREGNAHQHDLRFRENFNLQNPFVSDVIYYGHPARPEGQIYRNFSTGALYVVSNPNIIPRSAADVSSYVLSGNVDWDALGVDPMVLAHPASWTVDSHRQATRTKYPTPATIGNILVNPDGPASFPRYNHPEIGLLPNPGHAGANEAGLQPGLRPLNADTADGQHLIAASQFVGDGTVLVFASNFFSNFDVRPELDFYGQIPDRMNFNLSLNIFRHVAPEPTITDIADVWEMEPGTWVTIEGHLTSGLQGEENLGWFNQNSVYIQDSSGRGINLFEVTLGNAPGMQIGQTWRATGYISYYGGERQLVVHRGGSMRRIDTGDHVTDSLPAPVTITDAASEGWRGTLIQVTGRWNAADRTVTDAAGNSIIVQIPAEVTPSVSLDWKQDGMTITVIGIGSMGNYEPQIRVRNREEIIATGFNFTLPVAVRRNQTVIPDVTFIPANANLELRWSVNNPVWARINPQTGALTALVATGSVVVTATTPCGMSYSVVVRLSI